MLQVTTYGWNVGAQQQQQVCTTLSAIFFFLLQFLITFICVSKSLNDEERGGNCLLVPKRSYGPAPSGVQGQSHWSGSLGAKPPEAESFLFHFFLRHAHRIRSKIESCMVIKPQVRKISTPSTVKTICLQ